MPAQGSKTRLLIFLLGLLLPAVPGGCRERCADDLLLGLLTARAAAVFAPHGAAMLQHFLPHIRDLVLPPSMQLKGQASVPHRPPSSLQPEAAIACWRGAVPAISGNIGRWIAKDLCHMYGLVCGHSIRRFGGLWPGVATIVYDTDNFWLEPPPLSALDYLVTLDGDDCCQTGLSG